MRTVKAALAATSASLTLYSIYGALIEKASTGGVLPMLRLEVFMNDSEQYTFFDHLICAILFSIYPIWFVVRRNGKQI
jgi:hypothetical protein